MARSIRDWYADHAQQLPDDAPDDEVVETQAPWDTRSSGTATTRTTRRDAGYGGGHTSRHASTSARGADLQGRGARTAGRQGQRGDGTASRGLASEIRRAAHANPQLGHKRLAALLRTRGTSVTRAQVAEVLRRGRSSSSRHGRPGADRKPALVVEVTAAAQTSRTVHETPLCPSCGVRLSIYGICRCS
jgi:hypothetical protein